MLQIPLVAEFGTDHIKEGYIPHSGSIFLENVGGMTLKLGEKIEKHLIDQESLLIGRYFL